jgi:FlaA1/EpsC-like NDP-sugar epimerase
MNVKSRMMSLMIIDVLIVLFSVYTSYLFRFDGSIPQESLSEFWVYSVACMITCVVFMNVHDLYRRIWQYASIGEAIALLKAILFSCLTSYVIVFVVMGEPLSLPVFVRSFQTTILLLGGVRFLWRVYRDYILKKGPETRRALILGAGDCGTSIVKQLQHTRNAFTSPVAFIDDDPNKCKLQINGIPVVGDRSSIIQTIESYEINDVIIAMPSASKTIISELIEICKKTSVKVQMIPRLNDYIQGNAQLQQIRDVDVEDLLGRDAVQTDLQDIASYVMGKTVLVTGAGGSIGSELCRQISSFAPEQLLLLGHGENSIYNIHLELSAQFPELDVRAIIADVKDKLRIEEVFKKHRPHLVFHAAAHKHVPLMEENPAEAIQNNVFGTKTVAEAADKYKAERFVFISTDKAVNPTSVMGTTKRIAEMIVQSINLKSETKFASVRFGNVLGSRGSVIPRFKEQIAKGGPVTVTHPEMIRYFMTIPEAAHLVIQAGAFARGGEIFILDMGKPVRIKQLAEDLIRLSGYEPYVDIDIEYSGIRPGEKLYEELYFSEEEVMVTKHNRIFVSKPMSIDINDLEFGVRKLEKVYDQDRDMMIQMLSKLVPSYKQASGT